MRLALTYVDQWVLQHTGCLEATFRDDTRMKIITSQVAGIDSMNVVTTESGLAYVIGQPLYKDYWPGHIPAGSINKALYTSIGLYQNRGLKGKRLWEMFEDELATVFVEYQKVGR